MFGIATGSTSVAPLSFRVWEARGHKTFDGGVAAEEATHDTKAHPSEAVGIECLRVIVDDLASVVDRGLVVLVHRGETTFKQQRPTSHAV